MKKLDLKNQISSIVVIFITIVFAYLNLNHEMHPTDYNKGWNGFFDQSKYYLSAISIYGMDFTSDKHWYPIGYSAISAPFIFLNKLNPFIYVNGISFLIYSYLFLKFFRKDNIAIIALSVGLFAYVQISPLGNISPVIEAFIIPWNTVIISAAYLYLIVMGGDVKDNAIKIGLVCGFIIMVRAVDILPVLPFIVVGLIIQKNYYDGLKDFFIFICKIGGSSLIFIIPLVAFNYISHGNVFGSGYSSVSTNIGLGFDNIVDRFYWIFINPESVWNDGPGIFMVFPYLPIVMPFFIYMAVVNYKKFLQPFVLIMFSFILYLSYNDFSPHNVFRFRLIHYISWSIPLVVCIGVLGFIDFLKSRSIKMMILLMALVMFILSSKQIVVEQSGVKVERLEERFSIIFNARGDLDGIDLIGDFHEDWMQLTTADLDMKVDGLKLNVFNGYKVTPTKNGVRIIFNKNIAPNQISFVLTKIHSEKNGQDIEVIPINFLYKI